ncbi:MAG: hypothetical protein KDK39_13470 [Leptospiraceae bacterium]|nr:hypothetical protein [Leptospiraceae bacterium]
MQQLLISGLAAWLLLCWQYESAPFTWHASWQPINFLHMLGRMHHWLDIAFYGWALLTSMGWTRSG